jgi:hypothetical protein
LLVRVRGFNFFGGNSGVTLDESGHDTSGSLNRGQRRNRDVEKKILSLLGGVAGKDGSLDSSTIVQNNWKRGGDYNLNEQNLDLVGLHRIIQACNARE